MEVTAGTNDERGVTWNLKALCEQERLEETTLDFRHEVIREH